MKTYKYPTAEAKEKLTIRPALEKKRLDDVVLDILKQVQDKGDRALIEFASRFDQVDLGNILVAKEEIEEASTLISEELKQAIQTAKSNIFKFHFSQKENFGKVETVPGVTCYRRSVAIEKVGLYIPGGTAPLFSTVLMLGVPASIAGCREIVLCTPPNREGKIHPAILYTADLIGITKICKVGGAQAVGAMAYGTESVPAVSKIFGPGNQYVTKAKELVQQTGVAIDMPAGPSEVLVLADKSCKPAFVAADLLSQAEHGVDSQVVLVSDREDVITAVNQELSKQLPLLPRRDMAEKAIENSFALLLNDKQACLEFSNSYAPEHLIIASEEAESYVEGIVNAGSVFLGNYTCESAGDYASGTNHTLPTAGYARNFSGVSLDSFVKKITFQKISAQGIQNLGRTIEIMAEAEQLFAHKNAVSLRLASLNDK